MARTAAAASRTKTSISLVEKHTNAFKSKTSRTTYLSVEFDLQRNKALNSDQLRHRKNDEGGFVATTRVLHLCTPPTWAEQNAGRKIKDEERWLVIEPRLGFNFCQYHHSGTVGIPIQKQHTNMAGLTNDWRVYGERSLYGFRLPDQVFPKSNENGFGGGRGGAP